MCIGWSEKKNKAHIYSTYKHPKQSREDEKKKITNKQPSGLSDRKTILANLLFSLSFVHLASKLIVCPQTMTSVVLTLSN